MSLESRETGIEGDGRISILKRRIAELNHRMDEVRENPALSDADTVEALASLSEKLMDARLDLEICEAEERR